nr:immunoglobulin light chain junction region [Macaca mulatta]
DYYCMVWHSNVYWVF